MDKGPPKIRIRDGGLNTLGLKNTVNRQKTAINSLQVEKARLEVLSNVDAMTGLLNVEGMWLAIAEKCHEISRDSEQSRGTDGLGFVFYDFIQFHELNNEIGQENGNLVLKEGAELIRLEHRNEDKIARYGGDEDLAVMRVKSKNELTNIVYTSRHERSGDSTMSMLDSINSKIKTFLLEKFPDVVEKYGVEIGTFRSGYCYIPNETIVNSSPEEIQQISKSRLNILSISVKAGRGNEVSGDD
jgi:diguanylate cyclase (GGDEF)-like protein